MSDQNGVISPTAQVRYKLATVWHAKGYLERAISGYQEAIQLQPNYIPAYVELGNLLCQQNKLDEAIEVYRRAIEFNPNELSFPKKLADLLAQKKSKSTEQSISQPSPAYQQTIDNGLGHILLYTDCPGIHGAEQCNQLLMMNLVAAGYRVTCAQSQANHHLIQERQQAGIQHLWLADDDIYDIQNSAKALTNHNEAEQVFKTAQPDLIIFSNGCPVSNLAAKQVAARLKIPYVVVVHCVTANWAKKFAAHLSKLPDIYRQAEAVIAVSQENLDLLRRLFGLPNSIGQVVYNGRPDIFFAPVDLTIRQRVREALNIPNNAIIVFTSGRMEVVKGYQYQIKAIKQLRTQPVWPQLYFMWAGTGTLEAQLRAVIAELEAEDHVKFLGQRSDIPELLNAADIFVLTSQFEGMPLSVMEAMAKGLPVLATSVSGTGEELGQTGKLLPNPLDDPDGTVNGLVSTLADWAADLNLRNSIGQACQQRAKKLFTQEQMVKKYLELIQRSTIQLRE